MDTKTHAPCAWETEFLTADNAQLFVIDSCVMHHARKVTCELLKTAVLLYRCCLDLKGSGFDGTDIAPGVDVPPIPAPCPAWAATALAAWRHETMGNPPLWFEKLLHSSSETSDLWFRFPFLH